MSLIDQAMSEPPPRRSPSGWRTRIKNGQELDELCVLFLQEDEEIRRRFRYSTHLLKWLKEKGAVPANLHQVSFREYLNRLRQEQEYGKEETPPEPKSRRRSKK